MYRCYAGGWNCHLAYVEKWIANDQAPDAVYSSLEEASKNAYYDMDLCPDDTVWMIYPDGHIEEFMDW